MASATSKFDVVILGGGLTGLSLAIQLKRRRADTSVAVIEKRRWPVPEAADKVGESTMQIGAHYFREVCGMQEHLETQQLRKIGLRFLLHEARQPDVGLDDAGLDADGGLADRVEMALGGWGDDAPTYELDRGRFEDALAVEAERLGVELHPGTAVTGVFERGAERFVSLRPAGGGAEREVEGRWVVDASGRAAVLKRRFGLGVEVNHHCNAAWFRIGRRIEIDDCHLLGPGYCLRAIPLDGDATSFGLLADPDLVPLEEMRRFEPLMEWLHRHEPAVAAEVGPHRDAPRDFLLLEHYSHGCRQVFSPEGWCITGDAGVFLDPLYSPGSDMIAISNTMITRFVTASLEGKDVDLPVQFFNDLYLLIASRMISTWDHQYPIFANPVVTAAKVTWDLMTYLGLLALLAVSGKVAEPKFLITVLREVDRVSELNLNMQRHLRAWSELSGDSASGPMPRIGEEGYRRLEADAARIRDDEGVRAAIVANARRIEAAAIDIMVRSATALGQEVDAATLDPYVFQLDGWTPPPDEGRWRPEAPTIRGLREVSEPFERITDGAAESELRWAKAAGEIRETAGGGRLAT